VRLAAGLLACAALASCSSRSPQPAPPVPAPLALDPPLELFDWQRGLAVRAVGQDPAMEMSLWFYEWNLFDAFERGEITDGSYDFEHEVAPDKRSGTIRGPGLELAMQVDDRGVALTLTVENKSDHDWPDTAAIVACFNPGPKERRTYVMGHHLATFYVSERGFERLADRDMHFAADLRDELERLSPDRTFEFSDRWATSQDDARRGVLVRESLHGGWTGAIAWDSFLGVQAHNFWLCMHIATKVGPLARGAKKTLHGRIYLFPGTPKQAYERYCADFPDR
jgi:hypothetical protein